MRVILISPIPLLIKLIGLLLNILIIKKCKIYNIAKFTLEYQARKKIRNNVKLCLDLTKERHALLLEVNNLVKDNNDVKFCFVDINYCLKIKWEDELQPDSFFSSLEYLKGKLQVIRITIFFPSDILFHCLGLLLVSDFSHLYISWR